jgi:hypothetical protein
MTWDDATTCPEIRAVISGRRSAAPSSDDLCSRRRLGLKEYRSSMSMVTVDGYETGIRRAEKSSRPAGMHEQRGRHGRR